MGLLSGSFCQGAFNLSQVFCPNGLLSWVFCLGGFCPGGFCPKETSVQLGGFCTTANFRYTFLLESVRTFQTEF